MDNMKNKSNDELMRSMLKNYSIPAPQSMWTKVFHQLHGDQPLWVKWIRLGSFILVFSGMIASGYYLFFKENKTENGISFSVPNEIPVVLKELSLKEKNNDAVIEKNNPVKKEENKIETPATKQQNLSEKIAVPKKNSYSAKQTDKTTPVSPVSKWTDKQADNNASVPLYAFASLSENSNSELGKISPAKINIYQYPFLKNETVFSDLQNVVGESLNIDLEDEKIKIPNFKKQLLSFYVGANYFFNYTSIFNQNTYNEFYGKELKYTPTFGQMYGVCMGYYFSSHFGVEVQWIPYSKQGQHYRDEITINEIKYSISREVNLQYWHIPILFKFRKILFGKVAGGKISRNILVGYQNGFLKSVNLIVNGNKSEITDRFKKYDGNILLGWEYSVYFKNKIIVNLGLRSSTSITDINSAQWKVKDSYGMSHNFLLGIFGGVSYALNGNNKRYEYHTQ